MVDQCGQKSDLGECGGGSGYHGEDCSTFRVYMKKAAEVFGRSLG
jgi:hypothetical protein